MKVESKLKYNNKKYTEGKIFIAILYDYDETYKFKRKFLEKETEIEYDKTTNTKYYKYKYKINKKGFYHWKEENAFEKFEKYYKYENDILEEISINEINFKNNKYFMLLKKFIRIIFKK